MAKASAQKNPELVALGARVRALRLEAGLTQEELAARSGVHWTYVSQVERGTRNLGYLNLLALARGLRQPASKLVAAP